MSRAAQLLGKGEWGREEQEEGPTFPSWARSSDTSVCM